jgi:hypothetical protein
MVRGRDDATADRRQPLKEVPQGVNYFQRGLVKHPQRTARCNPIAWRRCRPTRRRTPRRNHRPSGPNVTDNRAASTQRRKSPPLNRRPFASQKRRNVSFNIARIDSRSGQFAAGVRAGSPIACMAAEQNPRTQFGNQSEGATFLYGRINSSMRSSRLCRPRLMACPPRRQSALRARPQSRR